MAADLLNFLLTADVPEPADSIDEWWKTTRSIASEFADSVDIAAATGFAAGSVAHAFGSGYDAALRRLVPGLGDEIVAFCATESGGGHPRAIHTTLEGEVVTGVKTFVTMGTAAKELLVVAKEGIGTDGRPLLRLARIYADQPGVTITARPPLPIVPELPHGEVQFDSATVDQVLEGDGYVQFVKPFRTVEDIHVSTATLGWLIRVARQSSWPHDVIERLLASVLTLRSLGQANPATAAVHVALGGALSTMSEGLANLEPHWDSAAAETAGMWRRDSAILQIANRARAARLESAWAALSPGR